MYNLRYHIASLVAVFLALTIGLLLGTLVVERGVLEANRTTLIDAIRKDVDKVDATNQQLRATNDALDAFAGESAGVVVRDALAGRTVAVVADPESEETAARTAESVRLAGGEAAMVTFTGMGLSLDDEKVRAAALKTLGSGDASQLETAVVDTLAREWTTPGDARALTAALVAAGGVRISGLTPTATVDGIAVSAVYGGVPDPTVLALARAIARDGRTAVGVETTKKPTGEAKAAIAAGLSGVNDVQSPLGQVALVWVLSGRASGSFGVGDGVDGPYPQPLFKAQ